MSVHMTT